LSAHYFIAQTVQANQYVVLLENKVVAGPFPSAKEAIAALEALLKV
jgi:hypothetical protein